MGDDNYSSLVRWRNIQGFLLLTLAFLPGCLYLGLNLHLFMKIWTTLLVVMLAAGIIRSYFRLRVDLD